MIEAVMKEVPWDGTEERGTEQNTESGMSWSPEERRKTPDPSVMSLQLTNVQKDLTEVKKSIDKLTDVISRMALIEERQTNNQTDTTRVFEKYERLEARVHKLEVSVPLVTAQSAQSSKWLTHILTGVLSAFSMFVAHQMGLIQ